MTDVRVNEKIVSGLAKHCGEDVALKQLLMNIIWAEAKNKSRWRDLYREEIRKCIEKRGQPDAN